MRTSGYAALMLTLSLYACGRGRENYASRDLVARESRRAALAAPMPLDQIQVQGLGQSSAAADSTGRVPRADATGAPMIIRTGSASIEVDSVDRAVTQVRALARSLNGYIANSSASTTDNLRSATLQLKVPVDRFDAVLTSLQPIGKVELVSVQAQDVGAEYVDVQSRIANSKRLEARMIALLDERSGKLKDVLDFEQEIARVQGEVEQSEGRLRYLQAHAAVSELDITVHEHSAVIANEPGEHPLRDATHTAWRNFVGLIAGVIASLGVLLPLGVVLALVGLGVRRFRRPGPVPSQS